MTDRRWVCAAAALAFAVLLYHACGTLAPYRDTGEFVTAAHHLNITHPTGYPVYTLLARVWSDFVPFGNLAYKLNAFSALCAAFSIFLAVTLMTRFYGVSLWAALSAAILLAFSQPLLTLSMVSEMYTAGLLFFLLLLLCIHQFCHSRESGNPEIKFLPHYLFLLCFLFPLALGIRMDLALSAVYVVPFFFKFPRPLKGGEGRVRGISLISSCFLFLILGLSVFLYLPIRSSTNPMINWADPSSWAGFLESVLRKKYSSGLDLISESYAKGDLFWDDFVFWLQYAWRGFGPLLLAVPFGLAALWKKRMFWPGFLCWLANVPFFIYLANMPLNPHAAQILTDHFIPGFVMLAIWIAVGLDFVVAVIARNRLRSPRAAIAALAITLVVITVFFRSSVWSLRRNFYAHDYTRHVFLSAPEDSILVLHEDVQLFAAWEAQRVRGKRPDLRIVGQGLSGTPWYQKNLREQWGYGDLAFSTKLDNAQAWDSFVQANPSRPLAVGLETDYQGSFAPGARGLVRVLCPSSAAGCSGDFFPWNFMTFRGSYRYDEEKLFFNQDLLEDYARASDTLGWKALREGNRKQARQAFWKAAGFKFDFPFAYSGLAFAAFEEGAWQRAEAHWLSARRRFLRMLDLAKRYRSLESVTAAINMDLSQVLVSLGVAAEKMGKPAQESLALFAQAVERHPGNVQAHYNMAASFWRTRDFANAKRKFKDVLALDPNHAQARQFLSQLSP